MPSATPVPATPGGVGKAAVVQGPKGNAEVGAADVKGGAVSNADRVVAGMRAGFRACYNRGLATNPDLQGRVNIVATVGPNGEVSNAVPQGQAALGDEVVQCVIRRVKSANFDPPQGGRATDRDSGHFRPSEVRSGVVWGGRCESAAGVNVTAPASTYPWGGGQIAGRGAHFGRLGVRFVHSSEPMYEKLV